MTSYAQPKMDELRQKYIENIRSEVERSTIEKLQQQLDADIAGLLEKEFVLWWSSCLCSQRKKL